MRSLRFEMTEHDIARVRWSGFLFFELLCPFPFASPGTNHILIHINFHIAHALHYTIPTPS